MGRKHCFDELYFSYKTKNLKKYTTKKICLK